MQVSWKIEQIVKSGVVAIVRGTDISTLKCTAQALTDGGIKAIEVALNTPGALKMIEQVAGDYGDSLLVGAGTALDPETARSAILAGASFVLSPSLNLKVVEVCHRYGVLVIPGVMTPTEIVTARESGCEIVKLFPAGSLGPGYIRNVLGPLPQTNMVAVGGVNLSNTADFVRSGAVGVGIGSELVNKKAVAAGKFNELTENAQKFLAEVKRGREMA